LLVSQLVELRYIHLHCVPDQFKIALLDFRMPLEEAGLIDEVLDNEVMLAIGVWQHFGYLLKRGNGRPDYVEQDEIEFLCAAQVEKPDFGEGLES
jgi:hypothetical protein